jgi:hypothetical protein
VATACRFSVRSREFELDESCSFVFCRRWSLMMPYLVRGLAGVFSESSQTLVLD